MNRPIKSTDPRKPAIVAAFKRHSYWDEKSGFQRRVTKVTSVRQTHENGYSAHCLSKDGRFFLSLGVHSLDLMTAGLVLGIEKSPKKVSIRYDMEPPTKDIEEDRAATLAAQAKALLTSRPKRPEPNKVLVLSPMEWDHLKLLLSQQSQFSVHYAFIGGPLKRPPDEQSRAIFGSAYAIYRKMGQS